MSDVGRGGGEEEDSESEKGVLLMDLSSSATTTTTHPLPPLSDIMEEELLLKWDDHHKSFFDLAEDLCHQEQFIDVTLCCGEHNFPAHKLILSVCSPYFRHLFLRNPCKHPIVVLKDVHFKYMKLLLMYMYRGEVSCPQEDLHGLLKTARSLQIRGLVELERKREAEGLLNHSNKKKIYDEISNASNEDFSIDDVRNRLHGQLEIQPLNTPSSSSSVYSQLQNNGWYENKRIASSSSPPVDEERRLEIVEDDNKSLIQEQMREPLSRQSVERSSPLINRSLPALSPPVTNSRANKRSASRDSNTSLNSSALIAAAQAAGMPPNALDPSDPMASMNALLAAAQAQQQQQQQSLTNGKGISTSLKGSASATPATTTTSITGKNQKNGVDLNQAAAMANKAATAGMSNPKERKECHVCGKTLYDRSTWNRHMRIHTGEKPYPCRFCGRRFRTNYNKLGHEKKCPDRHNEAIGSTQAASTPVTTEETAPAAVYR